MDYKNEKLNIEIIDNVFEIKEYKNYIELYFNKKLMYVISPNSKILSSVLDSGNVSIETYNNSRIKAYGKSLVTSHDNSRLEVCDSTKVISFNNSVIKAHDESSVTAYDTSQVEARDIAIITAKDNSLVIAYDCSKITAKDTSKIKAYDKSVVDASEGAVIVAYDNCSIIADNKVKVKAYGNSFVKAYQDSTVEVWVNSSAVAFNKAEIEAWGDSRVVSHQNSKITAYDSSEVIALGNSLIKAYCASKVRACANSKIMAYDFSTIYVDSVYTEIKTHNHYGAIIGQVFKVTKPIKVYKKLANDLIATLELSKGQEFQSEAHHKCRTDRALVVAIESKDKSKSYKRGVSQHDSKFIYEVGKEVIADKYDNNIAECSHGIHFFLNRKSAEEY